LCRLLDSFPTRRSSDLATVAVRRADEVVNVVPVDLVEVAAPLGCRAGEEVVERLEAEVAHPLRLVLVLGDLLDDLAAQALGRLVDRKSTRLNSSHQIIS